MTVLKLRAFLSKLFCPHLYVNDPPMPHFSGEYVNSPFKLVSPGTKTCIKCHKVTKR